MTLHEWGIYLWGFSAGVLVSIGFLAYMIDRRPSKPRQPSMPPISRRLEREIAELTKHL